MTTTVVLATATALALAGCGSSKSSSGGGLGTAASGTTTTAAAKTYDIGFEGPLSGPNAQEGINEEYAAEVAVAQANASSTLGFKVKLIKADDQGDAAKAPAAATSLVQDVNLMGVIGPSFSGATLAVGKIYGAAGVPIITPSATKGTLQLQGFKTFHRIVPNDNVEGSQGADWLARHGIKKLFVLQDLSAYGEGVGDTVAKEAKAKGVTVIEQGLDGTSTKNYNPIAQTITNSGATAIFYGGYDAQAALLAKALKSAGFKGLTVGGNGIKTSVFTSGAGSAGYGWYMTCGCQDATVAPQSKGFAAAYQAMFKTPPSTYSPEGYDATNLLIQAIKTAAASGAVTRSSVETAVSASNYTGITGTLKFQSNGDLLSSIEVVNLYKDEGGNIVELGNVQDQK